MFSNTIVKRKKKKESHRELFIYQKSADVFHIFFCRVSKRTNGAGHHLPNKLDEVFVGKLHHLSTL